MKIILKQLKTKEFNSFSNTGGYTLIYAMLGEVSSFNSVLKSELERHYGMFIKIGVINLSDVDYADANIQQFITTGMQNIGLPPNDVMLPGYYLFKKGRFVAFHPGTFDISKLNPKHQEMLAKFYLGAAIVLGFFTNSLTVALKTLLDGAETSTGFNIFQFFKEVLSAKEGIDIRKKQVNLYETELTKAYNLLEISSLSSDEAVKRAWKNKQKQYHPDTNLSEKEARNKMSTHINAAYELIKSSRRASKKINPL